MKHRNTIAIDQARWINSVGDRPIELLDPATLDHHLNRLDQFKLGLANTLGIDFKSDTVTRSPGTKSFGAESPGAKPSNDGKPQQLLFNYLTEITPLLESRVRQFPRPARHAYEILAADAIDSFWEIYYRFQPLLHRHARQSGVPIDDLGNVLGRTILLYNKSLGFTFYSYLEKTLRTAVKNLRGRVYADQLHLPLSAGRLMPQILWLIDQETLRLQRRLSPEECDRVVIAFLDTHPAHFAESTMQRIATVARQAWRDVSTELIEEPALAGAGNAHSPLRTSDSLDERDEYEHTLRRIHEAMVRAGFNDREQALLLERLNLAHDETLHAQVENQVTASSMQKRKTRLLVRFLAAMHAPDAKRFGRFLQAEPQASLPILMRAIAETANGKKMETTSLIRALLNHMSLTESPCKISISERGTLEKYLVSESESVTKITGHLFNKFKATLIEQDAKDFPCLRGMHS